MPKTTQVKAPGTSRPREYINPWKLFVGVFIPNWLTKRKEVSSGAKICYAQLCQHAGKEGNCFPSQETIAEELGCSERQVIRYLKELEKYHLVEVKRVGLTRSNRYFFLKHKWMFSDISYVSHQDSSHMTHPEVTDLSHQEVTDTSGQEVTNMSHHIVKESFKKNQPTNQFGSSGWLSNSTRKESFDLLVQNGVKSKVAEMLAKHHDLETITATVESVNESEGVKNYPGLIVDRLNTIKETLEKEREIKLERQQAKLQLQREREKEWERLKREKDKEIAEFHQWQQSHPGGSWSQFALATT